jgi:hypothetical protein
LYLLLWRKQWLLGNIVEVVLDGISHG